MALLSRLLSLAMRPCLAGLNMAAEATGRSLAEGTVVQVEAYLLSRFTDPSQELQEALRSSADRAWVCLEVALSAESFLGYFTRRGEDKEFSKEVRAFLDSNPLQLAEGRDAEFRRRALRQLRGARKSEMIPGEYEPHSLTKQLAEFTRYTSPLAVYEAEWQVLLGVADILRHAGHDALAQVIALRPDSRQPPLLTVAVRFCFRSEIEANKRLFQGLLHEQVDRLRHDLAVSLDSLDHKLADGFDQLLVVLRRDRERLDQALAGVAAQLDQIEAVAENTRERLAEVHDEVRRLNGKLDRLLDREIRLVDSMSIRNETDRLQIFQVIGKYRAIPEDARRRAPELLEAVARLEHAAGNLSDAQRDFQERAALAGDNEDKARAHYGAYLATLERHHWGTALSELQEAARLAPERYAPFPLHKYVPDRIIGAGGFGVVMRCLDVDSGGRVAVKILHTDELDRDAAVILAEVEQLETLEHENIIRLRTAGFADSARKRPYIVMSFFEGASLHEHIQESGSLPPDEAREIADQIAAGLQAAHDSGILHRDVKPGNVLARKMNGRWQVKLIDFGLALRRSAMQPIEEIQPMRSSLRGKSLAGTLEYAAPEQLGKVKGAAVGTHSDVFGFGRTVCYLLFKNPQPGPEEWDQLTDTGLKKLLGRCLKHEPADRLKTFAEVRQLLHTQPQVQTSVPSGVSQLLTVAAPLAVHVDVVPAPQVALSELPPLPDEILTLEGRLKGLREAIGVIEQGRHPDIRAAWEVLERYTTAAGEPVISALKQRIENMPPSKASELCALAPAAPQSALLVAINALNRIVELRRERETVKEELSNRQEKDFQAILTTFLGQSKEDRFPLGAWMRLEPLLADRRYIFVENVRELLRKAEEHFQHEEEERRQQEEAVRQQAEQRREESRKREEQGRLEAQEWSERVGIVVGSTVGYAILAAILGGVVGFCTCGVYKESTWVLVIGGAVVGGVLGLLHASQHTRK